MHKVTLLDTVVASSNLGDQIIMEAIRDELSEVISVPSYSVATHQWTGSKGRQLRDG